MRKLFPQVGQWWVGFDGVLVVKEQEHNTILTHVSALSSCTRSLKGFFFFLMGPQSPHPLILALVACQRAKFSPSKVNVHPCDFSAGLVALTEKFEPLHTMELEFLTYKLLSHSAVSCQGNFRNSVPCQ